MSAITAVPLLQTAKVQILARLFQFVPAPDDPARIGIWVAIRGVKQSFKLGFERVDRCLRFLNGVGADHSAPANRLM
jgi:hypothetical protein